MASKYNFFINGLEIVILIKMFIEDIYVKECISTIFTNIYAKNRLELF